jgi:hypothetical protein
MTENENNTSDEFINIKIFRDYAIIQEPLTKKKFLNKTVKLESLTKAFSETEITIASPILPHGCIRYKEKGNEVIVIVFHEGTPFDADCYGNIYTNCIRPNIIMAYYLNVDNGIYNIKTVKAFGVIDPIGTLNENTRLYGLPFPNVGTDGWVCWGSNSVAGTFTSLVGLRVNYNRFFAMPFNNHLFNSGALGMFGITTPQQLFTAIQDKNVFPNDLLENLGNRKIGDL